METSQCIDRKYLEETYKSLFKQTDLVLALKEIEIVEKNSFKGLSNLKKIHIPYNKLIHIEKDLFRNLTNLLEINLCGNQIECINKETFRDCIKLQRLSVSCNRISTIDKEAFKGLSNLHSIDFSINQIQTLDKETFKGLIALQDIDLSSNLFKKIDKSLFKSCTKLQRIKLTENHLEQIDISTFKNLPDLQLVSLDSNQLTNIDVEFKDIGNLLQIGLSFNKLKKIYKNAFRGSLNLQEIWLPYNDLNTIEKETFRGLEKLTKIELSNNQLKFIDKDAFKELLNLQEICLNENQIQTLDKDTFTGLAKLEVICLRENRLLNLDKETLKDLVNLKEIDLSYNELKSIDKMMFRGCYNLEKIMLNDNQIEIGPGLNLIIEKKVNFVSLRPAIKKWFPVNNINLVINDVDVEMNRKWLNVIFKNLDDLKRINLSKKQLIGIDSECFLELVNLEEIDLSNNQLEKIFKETFESLINLKWISLSNNLIRSIETDYFRNLKNLLEIDLSYNKIKSIESDSFVELVMLQVLDLSFNQLQTANQNTFKGLVNLKNISLRKNNIERVDKAFGNLVSLQKIDLSGNHLVDIEKNTFKGLTFLESIDLYENKFTFCEKIKLNLEKSVQFVSLFWGYNGIDLILKNLTNDEEHELENKTQHLQDQIDSDLVIFKEKDQDQEFKIESDLKESTIEHDKIMPIDENNNQNIFESFDEYKNPQERNLPEYNINDVNNDIDNVVDFGEENLISKIENTLLVFIEENNKDLNDENLTNTVNEHDGLEETEKEVISVAVDLSINKYKSEQNQSQTISNSIIVEENKQDSILKENIEDSEITSNINSCSKKTEIYNHVDEKFKTSKDSDSSKDETSLNHALANLSLKNIQSINDEKDDQFAIRKYEKTLVSKFQKEFPYSASSSIERYKNVNFLTVDKIRTQMFQVTPMGFDKDKLWTKTCANLQSLNLNDENEKALLDNKTTTLIQKTDQIKKNEETYKRFSRILKKQDSEKESPTVDLNSEYTNDSHTNELSEAQEYLLNEKDKKENFLHKSVENYQIETNFSKNIDYEHNQSHIDLLEYKNSNGFLDFNEKKDRQSAEESTNNINYAEIAQANKLLLGNNSPQITFDLTAENFHESENLAIKETETENNSLEKDTNQTPHEIDYIEYAANEKDASEILERNKTSENDDVLYTAIQNDKCLKLEINEIVFQNESNANELEFNYQTEYEVDEAAKYKFNENDVYEIDNLCIHNENAEKEHNIKNETTSYTFDDVEFSAIGNNETESPERNEICIDNNNDNEQTYKSKDKENSEENIITLNNELKQVTNIHTVHKDEIDSIKTKNEAKNTEIEYTVNVSRNESDSICIRKVEEPQKPILKFYITEQICNQIVYSDQIKSVKSVDSENIESIRKKSPGPVLKYTEVNQDSRPKTQFLNNQKENITETNYVYFRAKEDKPKTFTQEFSDYGHSKPNYDSKNDSQKSNQTTNKEEDVKKALITYKKTLLSKLRKAFPYKTLSNLEQYRRINYIKVDEIQAQMSTVLPPGLDEIETWRKTWASLEEEI